MKIVISGASGFLGSALGQRLTGDGHDVVRLVRHPAGPGEVTWSPHEGRLDARQLVGVEAAVHLSGAGIGDKRWSEAYRREIVESRTRSTDLLARALVEVGAQTLLSGSAVGFYGDRGDAEVDEGDAAGTGFLAETCVAWEAATAPAESAGLRVAHLRTGIVLDRAGGALKRQVPLVKLGLGGPLGSGRQWQPWITRTDWVAAVRFLLAGDVSGPVNLTAPHPARQREVAQQLGRALHRPSFLPTPRFALRLVLGGFADEGVLASQRVVPRVLERAGFAWRSDEIAAGVDEALRHS